MTARTKARHRKASRPLTPLSDAAPAARRGLAVAASSGLALTMIASAASAAGDGTQVGSSAGTLAKTGVGAIAVDAREAVTTNAEISTGSDVVWATDVTDVAEVTAEAPPEPEPVVEEAAPVVEEEAAPAVEEAAPAAAETTKAAEPVEAAPQEAPESNSTSTASTSGAAAIAMQYRGAAYVWGASGPNAFDCSGLVSYVYAQLGVSLPHSSSGILNAGGMQVSAAAAQPGDVIWWPGHVAIYAGDGMMVSAESESVGVQLVPVRGGGTYLRF